MRILCKIQTINPSRLIAELTSEATLIFNSTVSDGLTNNLSPKEVHFSNAPSNFPLHEAVVNVRDRPSANERSDSVLMNDVFRFLKRKTRESPCDYNKRLKPNDLVLKKRSSFPASSPRKLAFKLCVEPMRIISRVATNSYKTIDLISKITSILPGDLLIKTDKLTEAELIELSREMTRLWTRSCSGSVPPTTRRGTRGRPSVDAARTFTVERIVKDGLSNQIYSLKTLFNVNWLFLSFNFHIFFILSLG